ncbi:MAG: glutamine synthetase [Rhodobacter sp.]|nr:glutamine synthetase [Paracoccaceae bacterium]MCC0075480.1 glutamine synthetase [Rhodobacter sp.]
MRAAEREALAQGKLARLGLLDGPGIEAALDLLDRVHAEGFETIRVLFPDQHGILRGKAVVAEALRSVLANGMNVPSTLLLKDTSGRTVFPVWSEDGDTPMRGAGDVLLAPDPASFRPLPWAPHSAWLLCDPCQRDGAAIPFAPRPLLAEAVARLEARGMRMVAGLEVEFQVFALDTPRVAHADTTMPPRPPATSALAPGYQFLTEALYDRLEPLMDRLRRTAAGLGLAVRSTEVEMGPGQFEFTFAPDAPLAQADALVMFRTMVKEVCAREGLHATFMSRPRLDNAAASGWHLHQSLVDRDSGRNLFTPDPGQEMTDLAARWIAGLLAHARASCLLTTPTVNGYKRYQPFQLAPDRIAWGHDNRGAMIRALMEPGDPASRIENRVAEPAANPYYVFAAQIAAGLAGIDGALPLPPRTEAPYATGAQSLPTNLGAAIEAFASSAVLRAAFGDGVVDYLAHLKRAEWDRYLSALSDWEQAEYFSLY